MPIKQLKFSFDEKVIITDEKRRLSLLVYDIIILYKKPI